MDTTVISEKVAKKKKYLIMKGVQMIGFRNEKLPLFQAQLTHGSADKVIFKVDCLLYHIINISIDLPRVMQSFRYQYILHYSYNCRMDPCCAICDGKNDC